MRRPTASEPTSEAFDIIAAELTQVKAMPVAPNDLRKSAPFARRPGREPEEGVLDPTGGCRARSLSGPEGRVREAAADHLIETLPKHGGFTEN